MLLRACAHECVMAANASLLHTTHLPESSVLYSCRYRSLSHVCVCSPCTRQLVSGGAFATICDNSILCGCLGTTCSTDRVYKGVFSSHTLDADAPPPRHRITIIMIIEVALHDHWIIGWSIRPWRDTHTRRGIPYAEKCGWCLWPAVYRRLVVSLVERECILYADGRG